MVHVNNYSSRTIYIGPTIKCIPLKTENKMGEEESECFSISVLNDRFTVKKNHRNMNAMNFPLRNKCLLIFNIWTK